MERSEILEGLINGTLDFESLLKDGIIGSERPVIKTTDKELISLLVSGIDGYIRDNSLSSNTTTNGLFMAYDSNSINENSTLQIYYPSRGGYNNAKNFPQLLNYINNNGGSNIFASLEKGDGSLGGSATIENILNEIGNGINNVTISGLSLGGKNSVVDYKRLLEEFYTIEKDANGNQVITSNSQAYPNIKLNLTMYDPTIDSVQASRAAVGSFSQDQLYIMKSTGASVKMICPTSNFDKNWKDCDILTGPAAYGISTAAYIGDFAHEDSMYVTLQTGLQDYLDGKINIYDIKDYYVHWGDPNKIKFVNWTFCVPAKDQNGNLVWKSCSLQEIKKGLNNFFNVNYFNDTTNPIDDFLYVLRYVESNRVKIDFDFLGEITTLSSEVTTLKNIKQPNINIAGSVTLSNERDFTNQKCKDFNSISSDLQGSISKTKSAIASYEQLNRETNNDTSNL